MNYHQATHFLKDAFRGILTAIGVLFIALILGAIAATLWLRVRPWKLPGDRIERIAFSHFRGHILEAHSVGGQVFLAVDARGSRRDVFLAGVMLAPDYNARLVALQAAAIDFIREAGGIGWVDVYLVEHMGMPGRALTAHVVTSKNVWLNATLIEAGYGYPAAGGFAPALIELDTLRTLELGAQLSRRGYWAWTLPSEGKEFPRHS